MDADGMASTSTVLYNQALLYREQHDAGDSKSSIAEGLLAPSPDGQLVAIIPPGQPQLYLLRAVPQQYGGQVQRHQHDLIGRFKPDAGAAVQLVGWSADSSCLVAVCSNHNAVYVLDRHVVVQQKVIPPPPVQRAVLVGAACHGGAVLLLTRDARLFTLRPKLGQHSVLSLKGQHHTACGMALHHGRGLLAVAGPFYTHGRGPLGASVSLWSLASAELSPQLLASLGGPQAGACPPGLWTVALSPNATSLCVARPLAGGNGASGGGGSLLLYQLFLRPGAADVPACARIQQQPAYDYQLPLPRRRTGGNDGGAPGPKPSPSAWANGGGSSSGGGAEEEVGEDGGGLDLTEATGADWWDDDTLAVATAGGRVVLASPPGSARDALRPPLAVRAGSRVSAAEWAPADSGEPPVRQLLLLQPPAAGGGAGGGAGDWRVTGVWQSTAEEVVAAYGSEGRWGDALEAAQDHGLDPDLVHRMRWQSTPVQPGALGEVLGGVRDRAWVAEEASVRVADTVEGARALIEYGLLETERHCSSPSSSSSSSLSALAPHVLAQSLAVSSGGRVGPGVGSGGGHVGEEEEDGAVGVVEHGAAAVEEEGGEWTERGGQLWWRAQRLRLLGQSDRLDTLLEALQDSYHPAAWAEFRDAPLEVASRTFAYCGRIPQLLSLLSRHPVCLAPTLLETLEGLPETDNPSAHGELLSQVLALIQSPLPEPHRPADWAETRELAEKLAAAGQYALATCTERLAALRGGWRPPTVRQFSDWLLRRALYLDAATGQLQASQALLQLGLDLGLAPEPLEEALHAAEQLCSAARGPSSTATTTAAGFPPSSPSAGGVSATPGEPGQPLPEALWRASLGEYLALDAPARLALLLSGSSQASLPVDRRAIVTPFLERLPAERRGLVVAEVLARTADEGDSARLAWAAALLALEAQRPEAFGDVAQVAHAAAGAVYRWPHACDWDALEHLLDEVLMACKAAEAEAPAAATTSGGRQQQQQAIDDAVARLLQARDHVAAARLLSRWGMLTPVSVLASAGRQQSLQLLRSLLAKFGRARSRATGGAGGVMAGVVAGGDSAWRELWADVQGVWAGGPAVSSARGGEGEEGEGQEQGGQEQLSEQEVRAEFCRAMLRAGAFGMAPEFLRDLDCADEVVEQVGAEYFYSASNLSDPEVRQAQQCLRVMQPYDGAGGAAGGTASGRQLRAIEGLLALRSRYGIDLAPAEFKQMADRMPLVDAALDRTPGSYRDVDGLLALGRLLGLEGGGTEGRLLLRATTKAHEAGDLGFAQGLCLKLAAMHYAPAASMAVALAQDHRCGSKDTAARMQLMAFALAHCEDGALLDTMQQWRAVAGPGAPQFSLVCTSSLHVGIKHQGGGKPEGGGGGMTANTVVERLHRALRMNDRPLPDPGQANMVLGCLLALGQRDAKRAVEGFTDELASLPEGMADPSAPQRAMAYGMAASALRALQPSSLADPSTNAAAAEAEAARRRLGMAPGELAEAAARLDPAAVDAERAEARQDAGHFHARLAAACDAEAVRRMLPSDMADAGAALDAAASPEQRRQLAQRMAREAAAREAPAEGAAMLRGVVAVAERHGVDPWDVRAWYYCERLVLLGGSGGIGGSGIGGVGGAVLVGGEEGSGPAGERQQAGKEGEELAARPRRLLRMLCRDVLARLPGDDADRLAAALRAARHCALALQAAGGTSVGAAAGSRSEEGKQELVAAATAAQGPSAILDVALGFVRRCRLLASGSGFNVRLFALPLVQIAAAQCGVAWPDALPPGDAARQVQWDELAAVLQEGNVRKLAAAFEPLAAEYDRLVASATAASAPAASAAGGGDDAHDSAADAAPLQRAASGYAVRPGQLFIALAIRVVLQGQQPGAGEEDEAEEAEEAEARLLQAATQCRKYYKFMSPSDIAAALTHLAAGSPYPLPSRHLGTAPPPRLPAAVRAALLNDGLVAIVKAQRAAAGAAAQQGQQQRAEAVAAAAALRPALRASRAAVAAGRSADLTRAQRREFEACVEGLLVSSPTDEQGGGGSGGGGGGSPPASASARRLVLLLQQLAAGGAPFGGLFLLADLYAGVRPDNYQGSPDAAALVGAAVGSAATSALDALYSSQDEAAAPCTDADAAGAAALSPDAALQQLRCLVECLDSADTPGGDNGGEAAAGRDDIDGDGGDDSLNCRQQQHGSDRAGGGGTGRASARLEGCVDAARTALWLAMSAFQATSSAGGGGGSGSASAAEEVSDLLSSIGDGLWAGWQPPAGGAAGAAAGAGGGSLRQLLLRRTVNVLRGTWPGGGSGAGSAELVTAGDLASLGAADGLFLRLVDASDSDAQFLALAHLLGGVWGHGAVLVNADEQQGQQEQEEVVKGAAEAEGQRESALPLHRCWDVLLQRMASKATAHATLQVLDAQSSTEPYVLPREGQGRLLLAALRQAHGPLAAAAAAQLMPHPGLASAALLEATQHLPADRLSAATAVSRRQQQEDEEGKGGAEGAADAAYLALLLLALLSRGPLGGVASGGGGDETGGREERGEPAEPPLAWLLQAAHVKSGGEFGALSDERFRAEALIVPSAVCGLAASGRLLPAAALAAAHLRMPGALSGMQGNVQLLGSFLRAWAHRVGAATDRGWVPPAAASLPLPRAVQLVWQRLPSECEEALRLQQAALQQQQGGR